MEPFDTINSKEDILNIINSKEFKNLFNLFNSKEVGQSLEKMLEKEMPKSENEIYDEIVSSYFILLRLLKIDNFSSFYFPDYEDCRSVIVDGTEYDFDRLFCHDDTEAADALCAIDCLMSDLEEGNFETVLKKIEKAMNKRGDGYNG